MTLSTKFIHSAQDRKKALLGVCLCLFALSVTYRLFNPFQQERTASLTFPSSGIKVEPVSKGAEKAGTPDGREVWIDLFLNPPSHSGKVLKNVFYRKQETDTPEQPTQPEPVNPPQSDKRAQVLEELSHFRWFGYMQGKDAKILFLEKGKDILLVREGERIDGKYLMKRITDKYLIIRAEAIGEDVRIDLD